MSSFNISLEVGYYVYSFNMYSAGRTLFMIIYPIENATIAIKEFASTIELKWR